MEKKVEKMDQLIHLAYIEMSLNGFKEDEFENKIEIRPSSIAGNGVFTMKKIKKNEVITLYPAHFVIHRQTDVAYSQFDPNDYHKDYDFNWNNYKISGIPSKIDKKSFLGHMVNDGGDIDLESNIPLNEYHKWFSRYMISVFNKCNARFNTKPYYIEIVAIRDIEENEEILVPYGAEYWTDRKFGIKDFNQTCDILTKQMSIDKLIFIYKLSDKFK